MDIDVLCRHFIIFDNEYTSNRIFFRNILPLSYVYYEPKLIPQMNSGNQEINFYPKNQYYRGNKQITRMSVCNK